MIKGLVLLSILVFFALPFQHSVYARHQDVFVPPCIAYGNANIVFTGKVNNLQKRFGVPPFITLEVEKIFKAPSDFKLSNNNQITLHYPLGEGNFEFSINKKYLIYAYLDNPKSIVFISPGSRTVEIDSPGEDNIDFDYLNSTDTKRQRIIGTLIRIDNNYLKSIQIKVIDEKGNQIKAELDEWGIFKVEGISVGKYFVELFFPFKVSIQKQADIFVAHKTNSATMRYPAIVENGKCNYRDIVISVDDTEDPKSQIKH